jgi:ribosomal protein L11 methyltransferase
MPPARTKLSVRTDPDLARAIAGALENLLDPAPDALTRFEDGADTWRVEAYYPSPPDAGMLAARLGDILGRAPPPLELESVPDLNWVAISQAALPPVEAGRFVVHGSHDRGRIARGPHAILIDAGEAFGTAHHATTQGCLLAIDRLTRGRTFARVLDLGCGSGVLAIAAARALPGAQILATDSDAEAVAVATRNAKANGVGGRIAIFCARGLAHPWLRHAAPFDLVIANILAGPLVALAPELRAAVGTGASVVLSGLLDPEAAAVIAAYRAQGFRLAERRRIAGWSTLTLQRVPGRRPAVETRPRRQETLKPRIARALRGA